MTTEEKINVMQAHIDGKTIEMKKHEDWVEVTTPEIVWDWRHHDYRIKKDRREFWINMYHNDAVVHRSRICADGCAIKGRLECIHVVEV